MWPASRHRETRSPQVGVHHDPDQIPECDGRLPPEALLGLRRIRLHSEAGVKRGMTLVRAADTDPGSWINCKLALRMNSTILLD